MSRTVLVCGATGQVGSRVARLLAATADCQVRLLVRAPERVPADLAERCALVSADLADPRTLVAARSDLQGIDAALVVTPATPQLPQLERNLCDALLAHNAAPLLVKIAGLGTAADSFVDSGRWHASSAAYIRRSGAPYVQLRPLFFMQNLGRQLPQVLASGRLHSAVGAARIAMVHADDIAACAADLLLDGHRFAGQVLTLTGPQALDYTTVAELIGAVFDTSVQVAPITDVQLEAGLRARGEPDWHRQLLLQFNRAFRAGWAASPDPAVEQILGRPPLALRDYLLECRAGGVRATAAPAAT